MASRRFTTEFVIKGDSSSGVKASRDLQQANADLTREMQRAERQSEEMSQSFESVSIHAQRLATVSAATTAAMGAMAISQTRNVADQAALARSMDINVQTLQRWEFAAQSVNLGAGKMGDIFKDTADKVGDFVSTGGGEAADLFERLSLNVNELMAMSPDQQLLAIGDALDGVATQGEKVFFMEALANDASLLLPLLENNASLLKEQLGLADQLSVALPQSDIDSIEQANQALLELQAIGTGFANEVAAQWAPSIVELSDAVKDAVDDFGGMGEVVDTVSDGAVLLSGVLAGRLVGALGTATAATISKISADRAHIAALAEKEAMEAANAATVARTTAAEKSAAAVRATIAAERAGQNTAAMAQDLQRVESLQATLAAERALAAQRLQSQTTAAGRMQVQARIAQLQSAETAATNELTAASGRLTQAQSAEASAKRAASLASVEKTRADTAATTAMGAQTAAARAAATANGALATSARIASGALALIGGPLGAAVIAGGAAYYFRDALGFASAAARETSEEIDALVDSMDSYTEAQYRNNRVSIVQDLAEARVEAEKLERQMEALREQEQQENVVYQGRGGAASAEIQELSVALQEQNRIVKANEQGLREYDQTWQDVKQSQVSGVSIFRTLDQWLDEVGRSADSAGVSVNNGAPSDETLKAWGQYNDRLRESIAAMRDGGSAVGAANRAMDGMGDDVSDVMRGYTIFLTAQDEALKQQQKAQEENARAAEKAASAAERSAQRQAKAAQQQANSLQALQQEMDPLLADHQTYKDRLDVLSTALEDGTITQETYGESVRWAAEQYTRAATGAEDYEKQTETLVNTYDRHNQKAQQLRDALEQINQRWRDDPENGDQYARMVAGVRDEMQQLALEADPLAQEMAEHWEEATRRIDETFADAFKGAFDSFDDFADGLKNAFETLMAELAYAAVKNEIKIQLGLEGSGQQSGGISQMLGGGSSGGGFDLSNLGSIGNSVKGFFGGGSAASGGLYANAATASTGTLYGSAQTGAAVGSGAAGGGIMASAASMAPQIAAAYAAGQAIQGGLESLGVFEALGSGNGQGAEIGGQFGGIVGRLVGGWGDSLFGGKSDPQFDLRTVGDDVDPNASGVFEDAHAGVYSSGGFGTVGFDSTNTDRLKTTFDGFENAKQFLDSIAQADNAVSALAQTSSELDAMAEAVQGVSLRGDNPQEIQQRLEERWDAAIDAMSGEFGEFVNDLDGGIEQVVQQAQVAQQAHSLLSQGMERLNLQFNAGSAASFEYASEISEQVGGVQNLNNLQSSYYQKYFTEAERAANLQDDLAESLASVGLKLPETRDGFRDLVEAQNLNSESGAENYATLLQLSGAFDQLQTMMSGTTQATVDYSDAIRARQSLERDLLRAQGDTAALRQLEIDELNEIAGAEKYGLEALQERIWAVEEAAQAEEEAAQRQSEIARERSALDGQLLQLQGSTAEIRERELEALAPGNRALQERIWAIQDQTELEQRANRIASELASERESIQERLWQAQGNSEALRERELESVDLANRALLERTLALEESAAAEEKAARLYASRVELESEIANLTGDSAAQEQWLAESRRLELEAMDESLRPLKERAWALRDSAAAEEEAQQALDDRLQSAYSAVEAAVDAERDMVASAYDATRERIERNMDAISDSMQDTERAASSLQSALDGMIDAEADPSIVREQGQATLQRILASGGLGGERELERALSAVSEPSKGMFGSFVDYQRDFWQTANVVDQLHDRADEQLTTEERSLEALERQLTAAEQQHDAEMRRLDGVLTEQQELIAAEHGQLEWLDRLNDSVLTIPEAIAGLGSAIGAATAARPSGGSSSSGGSDSSNGGSSRPSSPYHDEYYSPGASVASEVEAYRVLHASLNGTSQDNFDRALDYLGVSDINEATRRLGVGSIVDVPDALPGFADGGIASGPTSGYPVELHGTEAVIPLKGGNVPVDINMPSMGDNAMLRELQRLNAKVERLESELREGNAINRGNAYHNSKSAKEAERMRRQSEVVYE